jgi:hypothetical protein
MSMYRMLQQLCAVLAVSSSLIAPALASGRGPSTADENARVVALAQLADKDPVGAMTSAEGRWFEKWVEDVPDYLIGPDKSAFWCMTTACKGEMKRVMRFHHGVSVAAFQVKNHILDPEADPAHAEAKTMAGMEGLLRAYESLLAKRPDNRSEPMDQAIAARDKGTLADFVKALPPMPKR